MDISSMLESIRLFTWILAGGFLAAFIATAVITWVRTKSSSESLLTALVLSIVTAIVVIVANAFYESKQVEDLAKDIEATYSFSVDEDGLFDAVSGKDNRLVTVGNLSSEDGNIDPVIAIKTDSKLDFYVNAAGSERLTPLKD